MDAIFIVFMIHILSDFTYKFTVPHKTQGQFQFSNTEKLFFITKNKKPAINNKPVNGQKQQ